MPVPGVAGVRAKHGPPGARRRRLLRPAGQVAAPATWNGRFWARTGCNFTVAATSPWNGGMGATGCVTGDCEGRLACNGSVGAPPATLVEVSLHQDPAKGSSFDVSLVDGYNLPVAVSAADPSKCAIAGCAKNVNAVCPPELQVTAAAAGGKTVVVACKSACLAFGLDAFCCRGAYATPATCRGTVYSRLFKDACPAYYSYAYDTTAATPSGCSAQEYVITFCPSRWGAGDDPGDRAAVGAAQI